MIRVHITTDQEFDPDDAVDFRHGNAIAFGGHLLSLDADSADVQLSVASKSGATQLAFRCLKGEGSVRRIVEVLHANGAVAKRLHYSSGMLSDGPDGEPAREAFGPDGRLLSQVRFEVGLLQDGAEGQPAVTELGDGGRILRTERYRHGQLHDGPGGDPAIVHFDQNGHPTHVEHFHEGEPVMDPAGGAARPQRPDGGASRRDRDEPGPL